MQMLYGILSETDHLYVQTSITNQFQKYVVRTVRVNDRVIKKYFPPYSENNLDH